MNTREKMRRNGRSFWHALFAAALLFVFGCKETADQAEAVILVSVHSNLTPGVDLTHLTATILGPDGQPTEQAHAFTFDPRPSTEESSFLVSFGVQGQHDRTMRLRLTGYRGQENPLEKVIEQTFHARFIPGATGVLVAFLADACIGVFCSELDSCEPLSRTCVPVEETELIERSKMPDETDVFVTLQVPVDLDPAENLPFSMDGGDSGLVPPLACLDEHDRCDQACVCECEDGRSSVTQACGACSKTCEADQACHGGECVVVAASFAPGSPISWEAGRVYGIRVVNHRPGLLAGFGVFIATPNAGKLRLSLYDEVLDIVSEPEPDAALDGDAEAEVVVSLPFTRLFYSDELPISEAYAEWSIPVDARQRVEGAGEAFWLFFTLSERTQLFLGTVDQPFWKSTSSEYGPIDEQRLEDEYQVAGLGLSAPSVFLTIVPD